MFYFPGVMVIEENLPFLCKKTIDHNAQSIEMQQG